MGTDSTSTCDALRELVGALALGEEAWLSDDERRRAEAHAADCPACRAYMADIAAIAGALREVGKAEPDIEVPERILLETRLRILAAVRAKTLALRRQRLESAWRRRARLWWSACAAAAVLVAGLGLWWLNAMPARLRDAAVPKVTISASPPGAALAAPAAQQHPAPPPVEPATDLDATSALKALKRALARAQAGRALTAGELHDALARARALRERWPDSDEATQALRLVSLLRAEAGDRQRAHEAFLAYADELAARARADALATGLTQTEADARGRRANARALVGEATRLFRSEDWVPALTYCDLLLTRYPGTDAARRARYMTAEYHEEMGQPAEAIKAYEAIIREAPDSSVATSARQWLPTHLFNVGRQDEAVESWLEYSRISTDYNERACGYCAAGVLAATRGQAHHPEAIRLFRIVLADYPASSYVPQAKAMIAKLSRDIDDQILNGLLDR